VNRCHKYFGPNQTVKLLDSLKDLGFEYATLGGISISVSDLKIPVQKQECLDEAFKEAIRGAEDYIFSSVQDDSLGEFFSSADRPKRFTFYGPFFKS